MEAIVEAINLINENTFTLVENDDSKKSYFSFPKKSDVDFFKKIGKSFF